ncbi:hypothetical protein BGZ46_004352, partial [Entomortierella lignicola]
MDNTKSGMVTPIISPRPIQSQKPLTTAEESWKIVGSASPPGRPLLSPPEERKKAQVIRDNDTTSIQGNRNKALPDNDLVDLTDSTTISTISVGTSSISSSASSNSIPASPTSPQHKQAPHRILTGQELSNELQQTSIAPGALSTAGLYVQTSTVSVDHIHNTLVDEPVQQHIHFKSSSTGALPNKHLESSSFSLLGEHGINLGESYHSKSHSLNGLRSGTEATQSSLKQNGSGLDLSLSLSSFIWNDRESKDQGMSPVGSGRNINSSHIDSIGPSVARPSRSLSFSDSGFPSAFGFSSTKLGLDQEDEDVLRYRPPLPIMEEETDDSNEPRMSRMRSFSTSAALSSTAFQNGLPSPMFTNLNQQDHFALSGGSFSGSGISVENESGPSLNRKLSGGISEWPNSATSEAPALNRRRSVTSNSAYNAPIWESNGAFQPLASADSQVERQRIARRFSLAHASGFQNYDAFLDNVDSGNSSNMNNLNRHTLDNDLIQQAQRRHSVAGLGGSYNRPNATALALASSLESLQLNDMNQPNSWSLYEEPYEDEYQIQGPSAKELGKGLSLGQLPHCGSLYVVEFKAGRNDLFYIAENSGVSLKTGNLVIVEADRGKDLGKITNDSITPQQIQAMQAQQAEIAAMQALQDGSAGPGAHRTPKEIHPKRIFRLAQPTEIAQLVNKSQDEIKAMVVCQTKVRQKRLPMEVVDAEYQWDRRKLTFYFIAERRIDFRELVRDLFKIYKTRIWMYAVSPSMAAQSCSASLQSSSPPTPSTPLAQQHQHQQQIQQQHLQGSSVMNPSPVSRPHTDHPLSP